MSNPGDAASLLRLQLAHLPPWGTVTVRFRTGTTAGLLDDLGDGRLARWRRSGRPLSILAGGACPPLLGGVPSESDVISS